ncbi:TPM domain-containing protein [Paenibacillus sp. GYB003]|uniref:TPM domain-containing protein n=1 Tax=Paenibacillus sp. GYB003 TaxID=2994392 RepID=UPI002F96DB95
MRAIVLALLAVLLHAAGGAQTGAAAAPASGVPAPVGDIYVQDFARILDDDAKQELVSYGETLETMSGAQLALLTVASLEGRPLEQFANEALRAYGLGQRGKDNGVLIVLAAKEKQIRIEVGYGLESVIPDSRAGSLLDEHAAPYVKAGKLNDAAVGIYLAVFEAIASEAVLGAGAGAEPGPSSFWERALFALLESSALRWTAGIALALLMLADFIFLKGFVTRSLLLLLSLLAGRRSAARGRGGSSGGGGASRR